MASEAFHSYDDRPDLTHYTSVQPSHPGSLAHPQILGTPLSGAFALAVPAAYHALLQISIAASLTSFTTSPECHITEGPFLTLWHKAATPPHLPHPHSRLHISCSLWKHCIYCLITVIGTQTPRESRHCCIPDMCLTVSAPEIIESMKNFTDRKLTNK